MYRRHFEYHNMIFIDINWSEHKKMYRRPFEYHYIIYIDRARKNVEFGNDIAWKFVSLPGNFGSQYKFRQVFLLCFVRSRAIKFVVYIQLCYGVCMDVRW